VSTLKQLHDLLLDRSKWPDDFTWDYSDTSRCAIGLACASGLLDVPPIYVAGYHFGISNQHTHELFFTTHNGSYAAVTPEVVAERIANIL
jgi:hypothetical protein